MKTAFKKLLPWLLLLLCVGGLVIWYFVSNRVTTAENVSYDAKIKEAKTWYDSREYSTAMAGYYSAADMIPTRVEAFQGIMTILIDKNRVDDALAILDKSAQKLSSYDQSTLYAMVGNSYFEKLNYDKALETYKKGQGLGVNNQQLELMMGKVYLKKGDIDNATKQFEKDLFTDEYLAESKLLLSYIQATSNTDTAKNTLGSISPAGKWKPYYDEFTSVLGSLNGDTKFNATKLSRIYINNGYPYLAIKVLEPMETQLVEYLEGVYFLGRAYLEVGDYDKALTELDKAATLGGMEDSIFWAEARAYMQKNDLNNVISNYNKAVGYQGKNPSQDLISEYFDVLLANNQTLKANDLLQSTIKNVKSPYLYMYGIKINYVLNSTEKINYYLSLLEGMTLEENDKKEYLYLSGKAMLDQNADITKITQVLEDLLKLDRYNPKYYLLLGRLQFEQGQAAEASNAFKKAIEYDLNGSITDEATRLLSSVD